MVKLKIRINVFRLSNRFDAKDNMNFYMMMKYIVCKIR